MSSLSRTTTLILAGCASAALWAADPFVDVTAKVAPLAGPGSLKVQATNDAFTDPAEGEGKTLRVEYTLDGKPGVRSCRENGYVVLTPAPGAHQLVVTKATYGVLPEKADQDAPGLVDILDVTSTVKALVKDGKLSFEVTNDGLGGDPMPGTPKQLNLDYSVGGKPHSISVIEGDPLSVPTKEDGSGTLVIIKARYDARP